MKLALGIRVPINLGSQFTTLVTNVVTINNIYSQKMYISHWNFVHASPVPSPLFCFSPFLSHLYFASLYFCLLGWGNTREQNWKHTKHWRLGFQMLGLQNLCKKSLPCLGWTCTHTGASKMLSTPPPLPPPPNSSTVRCLFWPDSPSRLLPW